MTGISEASNGGHTSYLETEPTQPGFTTFREGEPQTRGRVDSTCAPHPWPLGQHWCRVHSRQGCHT